MPIWLGIIIGLMMGLVIGVTTVAVAMSSGHGEWVTPVVIGPSIGAFLAAMVGVGGAIWSHKSDVLERKRERKETAQAATKKLILTTLDLCSMTHLQLRELRRIVKDGKAQPVILESLQEGVMRAAQDVMRIADHDDLPPKFSAMAKNHSRGYAELDLPITFSEEHLVSEAAKDNIAQMLVIYETNNKMLRENLSVWCNFAEINDVSDTLFDGVDDLIEQVSGTVFPNFKL